MGQLEDRNKELARTFMEALSRADTETIAELYAEDFQLWVTGSLPFSGTKGRTEALAGIPAVLGLFPDGLEFQIHAMTAEGERVAIEATSRGTTAKGYLYEQPYHFLLRARDRQTIDWREHMDTELAREVLVGG